MQIVTTRGRFELIERGQGKPLVLLHPFPFSAEAWSTDADALASHMRVLAPSMRGFGGIEGPELVGLSMDAMADDVGAILDALGVAEPVVLGGLSMGGYVTMAFARRHAARLRAVVLADTRAEPDTDEARASRDRGIARIEGGDLAGFVDALVPGLLAGTTRSDRPGVALRVREMAMRSRPDAVIATLRALRDRPDARPGLASLAVPALVVVGEDDALTPPAAAQAIASAIPAGRASVHVIPGAGHLSNLEAPEAFRGAVRAFMERV